MYMITLWPPEDDYHTKIGDAARKESDSKAIVSRR
jgi:hypothetical protein